MAITIGWRERDTRVMHSRVITVVRHVGRRVKIRATFAPAIVSPLSLIPPSSRNKKKKKKGQIVAEVAFA